MDATVILLLCSFMVAHSLSKNISDCNPQLQLKLEADEPLHRVRVNSEAVLKCCYERVTKMVVDHHWVARYRREHISAPEIVDLSPRVTMDTPKRDTGLVCQTLTLQEVQVNDTGLYQCFLNSSGACLFTHGTYLQVYTPLRRALDISESWKNSIITIEGVLLLFSVLLPGICQLGKTKRLTQLSKKKHAEEENIYEGLNLDDCDSTYHQIQRSHLHGPYQDVAHPTEEEIQLEKP
ncbi:hypothetical protein ACEWY4_019755 [Coilia grayii]|uniref:Ig-like domain-containing protein n=1 Tax=Coilia grayii TaxID=363190 RepID=A0ABD1JAV6_9TELE